MYHLFCDASVHVIYSIILVFVYTRRYYYLKSTTDTLNCFKLKIHWRNTIAVLYFVYKFI